MKNTLESNLDEWIDAALNGELQGPERREFDDYLAANPEARQAYEETQAMNRLLEETLKKDRPDPGFEERMVHRFRKGKQSRELGFWKNWTWLWQGQKTVYAGAVAALVLSFYIGGLETPQGAGRAVVTHAPYVDPNTEDVSVLDYVETSQKGVVLSGYVDSRYGYSFQNGERAAGKEGDVQQKSDSKPDALGIDGKNFEGFIDYGAPVENLQATVVAGETEVLLPQKTDRVRGAVWLEDSAKASDTKQLQTNNSAEEAVAKKAEAAKALPKPSPAPANGLPPEENSKKRLAEQKVLLGDSETESTGEIQRKLIRNAGIGLEVKSYAAAVRDLSRLAEEEKGFVATQNDRTQANGHTAGQVVIKLPPARLDEFVLRLRELGNVQRQVLKMDDVTKAYFDTEARLRNARKTEERLLELMAKKTDKVADLLQVEKEIGRVRESIEQMQGELKLWDSLANLATVTIDLVEQDMDQAAAYLLKETANLSLYSADVEKSYNSARELAEKSEAQIVSAQINRSANEQMNATLSLLAAPEKAFLLIEQLKSLGRVQSFVQDSQRVAQDGHSGITGTTRRDKVEIEVSIAHDDASRKTVTMQVVTPEVEKALDACKKAALSASGEVLASTLQRSPDGHSRAVLTVRLPAKKLEETKAIFTAQGRVARLSVDRSDDTGTHVENEDASPVILALNLSDEEPPVQITKLDVQGEKVASKVEELKKRARDLGIEIRSSSFVRQPSGVEQANLVFRMTQKEYTGMLESLLATGKTLNLTLERSDRIDSEKGGEASEPVEVLFRLKSPPPLVSNNDGFVGAVKTTLSKSFHVLGASLQRIMTGFAFLLPWLVLGGGVLLGWRVWRKRGK